MNRNSTLLPLSYRRTAQSKQPIGRSAVRLAETARSVTKERSLSQKSQSKLSKETERVNAPKSFSVLCGMVTDRYIIYAISWFFAFTTTGEYL